MLQTGLTPVVPYLQVEFQNVQMRYRDGLPLVLRGLSVTVAPGSRCGVVGRTGAGKSSLINCLFRRARTPLVPHRACTGCLSEMSHERIYSPEHCWLRSMAWLGFPLHALITGVRLRREPDPQMVCVGSPI